MMSSRVAVRAGLGQAVRAELLAGGERAEVSVLLLLCPGQVKRVAAEAGVRADDDADAPDTRESSSMAMQ